MLVVRLASCYRRLEFLEVDLGYLQFVGCVQLNAGMCLLSRTELYNGDTWVRLTLMKLLLKADFVYVTSKRWNGWNRDCANYLSEPE